MAYVSEWEQELLFGSRIRARFRVQDGDTLVAQNITGWSFFCTGKVSVGSLDAAALFQLTIGAGLTVDDAAGGLLSMIVEPSDYSELDPGRAHVIQIDLKGNTGGDRYGLVQGRVRLVPTPTRS